MESIAVLGPGGVGGFVAAALAHAGEPVTVIARPPTAEVLARDGIRVRSVRLGEFVVAAQARTELDGPGRRTGRNHQGRRTRRTRWYASRGSHVSWFRS